ncbi:MAG: hypothetical protein AAB392_01655 [Patescibacteria group bacterium]
MKDVLLSVTEDLPDLHFAWEIHDCVDLDRSIEYIVLGAKALSPDYGYTLKYLDVLSIWVDVEHIQAGLWVEIDSKLNLDEEPWIHPLYKFALYDFQSLRTCVDQVIGALRTNIPVPVVMNPD